MGPVVRLPIAADPGPLVPGKATDGPAAATTPSAERGAFQIAVYFFTCSSKV